jgi:hypothetical protein
VAPPDADLDSSPDAARRLSKSRQEWERPWRSKPPELKPRAKEKTPPHAPTFPTRLKKKEDYEKPWRQSGLIKRNAKDIPLHKVKVKVDRQPAERGVIRHATERTVPETGTKAFHDHVKSPAAKRPALGKDAKDGQGAGGKENEAGNENTAKKGANRGVNKNDDAVMTSTTPGRIRVRVPRRMGGSDPSLDADSVHQQQQQQARLRQRSRIRQISSASSLPSVPEAAAESEVDHDPVRSLTSDPKMAALVAAVPRRQKRGRRGPDFQVNKPASMHVFFQVS